MDRGRHTELWQRNLLLQQFLGDIVGQLLSLQLHIPADMASNDHLFCPIIAHRHAKFPRLDGLLLLIPVNCIPMR
jgi:hypothetical protein